MSLIKDYFEKTEKYKSEYGEKTIVVMQVGGFFEIYGTRDDNKNIMNTTNISDFSSICDLNIVDKKISVGNKNLKYNTHDVVMAGFKTQFLDKYICRLQDAGYTSIVFTQDEQAPNTTRSLFGIFSPGTYFSPDTDLITNNTMCVWFDLLVDPLTKKRNIYVGVSNIDICTGKTSIFEFNELYIDSPTTFDELERSISIYNPSECILIYNSSNFKRKFVDNIIKYTNIKSSSIHFIDLTDKNNICSKRANNCQKQTYHKELLERFYIINDFSIFIHEYNNYPIATQSFCYLLDFIYQHNPNLVNKISEPIFENFNDRLILATHTLKQLNIIDDHNYKGKYSSVIRMLNECITSMGKRKFTYQILNPTTNISYLQNEYDITEYLLTSSIVYNHIRSMLGGIKDLAKINRSIIVRKLHPKIIYQLYNNLQLILALYNYISDDKIICSYLFNKQIDLTKVFEGIQRVNAFLTNTFHIDMCNDSDVFENVFIRQGINTILDEKTRELIDSEDMLGVCKNYFHNLLLQVEKPKKPLSNDSMDLVDDNSKDLVKIYETEKNNFSLIATEARSKKLKTLLPDKTTNVNLEYDSRFSGNTQNFQLTVGKDIVEFQKQTASNNKLCTPQLNSIYKTINSNKLLVKELVKDTYNNLVVKMDTFYEDLEIISEFITYIDIIQTKAYLAKKYNYFKPEIDNTASKSFVKCTNLRHVLIENIQNSELYVGNDINLGSESSIDGMLLYGTNAVGKTSFIRSIGISIIMAQAGLYVPATTFVFKPYKYIFTRILGNDNLFEGLSTFAVEMSELRTILRLSNSDSLVLGDELCSGTESISASSIFVAGIQNLAAKGCSFIFATHLHEISGYDEISSLKNVGLSHMEVIYDKERDMLVYDRKLKDGPGNSMYGLEVCKSLGLPQHFLESANNIRMKYHPESASILDKKQSRYNSKSVKTMCEKCGLNPASETHHLIHQQDATVDGLVMKNDLVFHKNHQANLINLCDKCHDEFHLNSTKQHKKVKTTKGTKLVEL